MESMYFYIGSILSLLNFTVVNWIARCIALLCADIRQARTAYLATAVEAKFILRTRSVTQICSKIKRVLPWSMLYPDTNFPGNQFGRFYKQSNRYLYYAM